VGRGSESDMIRRPGARESVAVSPTLTEIDQAHDSTG